MGFLWNIMLLAQEVMTPELVFLTVFLFSYKCLNQRRKRRSQLPGPTPLPIIGNAYCFIGHNLRDTFKFFHMMFETYGSVFTLWVGPLPFIFTASVAINEKVLTTRSIRNRGPFIEKVGGDALLKGILVASNERWHIHRKILTSTLHHNVLQNYVRTYVSKAKGVADTLLARADGSAVDIPMLFIQCTLSIICETMMGITFSSALTKDIKFITAMLKVIDNFSEKGKRPWLLINWIYKRSQLGKENQECIQYGHGILREVISEKKRLLEERNLKNLVLEGRESVRRGDLCFIDLLLMDGHMTEEDILGECVSIVGAGSDTTSWTCCYILTLLAEHPDVQDKVMQEQAQIFDSNDFQRPVTPEDLPRMAYLEQVIKETLRLYPLVPCLIRHMETDTDIGDGKIAPAGSHVLLFTLKFHRDPRNFPDPLKFDPDRFKLENERKRHPYAYLPLGAGQRMCLGYKIAMMEMKSILSTVLRHVKVTEAVTNMATLEEDFIFGVVMKPDIPIRLRFSPRNVT